MPARVLHDAIWMSQKLAAVEPQWVRPEYAWLYPLAHSNGVFEFNARSIWARCYAFNRPDRNVADVEMILASLERAKLLFVWEQDGKRWAYWTGSNKPGRLPRASWRKRDAEKGILGPDPPQEELQRFQNSGVLGTTRVRRPSSTPQACNEHASGVLGSGSGSGEKTSLSEATAPDEVNFHPTRNPQPSEVAGRLARLLRDRILENNPKAKVTEKQVVKWASEVDLMIRHDGRTEREIQEIIKWCQQDLFWKTVILSMAKLRDKFDQLTLKKQMGGVNGKGSSRADDRTRRNLATARRVLQRHLPEESFRHQEPDGTG